MSPTNQRPENELDHVTAPVRAELMPVSPDKTFVSESDVEEAIAEQREPSKKVTIAPQRAGQIYEVAPYPRWVKALRIAALVAQIAGAFGTGYTGTRKFLDWAGLSGMSYWDMACAAWSGIRKLIGYST